MSVGQNFRMKRPWLEKSKWIWISKIVKYNGKKVDGEEGEELVKGKGDKELVKKWEIVIARIPTQWKHCFHWRC